MPAKVKVQQVSRVGLAPLVEMAEHLRASLPGFEDLQPAEGRPSVHSDLAHDFEHLARHDADGFLTATIDDNVVGCIVSFVRSRQLTLAQLWLLPDDNANAVGELLLKRALAFGERSGAQDACAHLVGHAGLHALAFRFGLRPRFPVYRLLLSDAQARVAGRELAKLLPGAEATAQGLERRSAARELERLDRLARGVARPMDHEYWLNQRRLRLALVREGQRVAAYAYGGPGQCGPVAASTQEAGLAALGWALEFAAEGAGRPVEVLVPAPFESAMETLLDAGAVCRAATTWMSRHPSQLDRYLLASHSLL